MKVLFYSERQRKKRKGKRGYGRETMQDTFIHTHTPHLEEGFSLDVDHLFATSKNLEVKSYNGSWLILFTLLDFKDIFSF